MTPMKISRSQKVKFLHCSSLNRAFKLTLFCLRFWSSSSGTFLFLLLLLKAASKTQLIDNIKTKKESTDRVKYANRTRDMLNSSEESIRRNQYYKFVILA